MGIDMESSGKEKGMKKSKRKSDAEGKEENEEQLFQKRVAALQKKKTCFCFGIQHIPYILFLSDVITALGSGMTVKFFPLYFKNDIRMSPAEVQYIYTCAPAFIS